MEVLGDDVMPSHELGFKAGSLWLQGLWSLSSRSLVLTEGQCVSSS